MAPPPAPAAGANGLLPVPAAVLQKSSTNGASRGPSNRSAAPRLKVVVRRLPPGLAQQEFEAALGDEWKLGAGQVDWFSYRPGKVSKDIAKPSRPSRAYLRLTDQAHTAVLADKVRQTPFTDAKNTTKDPSLIGPPVVAFAPLNKAPAGRRRVDQRQGTIDQDPEFKDFLESLTNPVAKPTPTDVTTEPATEKGGVKTTPLIEHLREKKAAKEKPQPVKVQTKGKHARIESKEDKAVKPADTKAGRKGGKDAVTAQEKNSKADKPTKEAAAKEAAKALNKEVAAKAKAATASPPAAENDKPASGAAAPERRRGNASVAKQMLQRDLAGALNPGGRRSRREAAQDGAPKDITAKPAEAASAKDSASTSPAPPGENNQGDGRKSKKETPESRTPKNPRPTRAERRANKVAASKTSEPVTEPEKPATPTSASPAGPKILKKPQTPQPEPQAPAPKPSAASATPPTGPAALKPQPSQAAPQTPAPKSRHAFLKHANPSQGVTEPLIEAALAVYGPIQKVEIDKRKGFAYVEFADADGLAKAIAASPVKVAEGAVQVLERKDRAFGGGPAMRARGPMAPPAGPVMPRGGGGLGPRSGPRGRGGRGAARGGAAVTAAGAASAPASPSPVASPAPVTNDAPA